MIAPAIPRGEEERLAELDRLDLLNSGPEEAFDRVTAKLAEIFDVPVATMSLIGRDMQVYKSQFGLGPGPAHGMLETPRELSVCGHVVAGNETLVVDDMAQDERFVDNPMIRAAGARFYAGAPLRTESGHAIGSLCIIDTKPRHITERERHLLELIADSVMKEAKLRLVSRELVQMTRNMQQRGQMIERDLAQAAAVQQFLLPPAMQEQDGFLVAHIYHPMRQIGGDFVDVALRDDGRVVLLLADVSGHGASAAMTAAMTKTAFLRTASRVRDTAELLTRINAEVGRVIRARQFMTAVAAMFDPREKVLQLSSAGHPYPIITRQGATRELKTENDFPLLLDDSHRYETTEQFDLDAGDQLLLYTDGAIEASDAHGELLGAKRLQGLAHAAHDLRGPAFLARVFAGITAFADDKLSDDVAMVTLECRAKNGAMPPALK